MIELLLPRACFVCQAPSRTLCCEGCMADLPFAPYHCLHCSRAVAQPNSLCKACVINPAPYHYKIPLLYQAPVSQMIGAFKLRQQEYLCAPLASVFVSRFSNLNVDRIIPVPSHPKRMWQRGYNPALLIARQLSKRLGIPLDDRAVSRVIHTAPQRLQNKENRHHHLSNVFRVNRLEPGLKIALVDDVVTTGETLRALTHVIAPFTSHIEYWAIAESPHIG